MLRSRFMHADQDLADRQVGNHLQHDDEGHRQGNEAEVCGREHATEDDEQTRNR